MIPFLDLAAQNNELDADFHAALTRVLKSGTFILGEEVNQFEREFAAYCDTKHCIGVSNGLSALKLILLALDIGPGDEVIVPSNTFIATWLAVTAVGATPIPIDPQTSTYNLNTSSLEKLISSKTKAIIPVHLYGQPADMDAIQLVASSHNIPVIEDAAQAHGATYKKSTVGGLGIAAAFSFYPGKNLGALGDAGAITTNSDSMAEKLKSLRNYGSSEKYVHQHIGSNERLDELQASFLSIKLQRLTAWNNHRRKIAKDYNELLKDSPLVLPFVPEWADPVWHLYVIQCPQRDMLQDYLLQNGISTIIHYPIPPHMQNCYADLNVDQTMTQSSEDLATTLLSLPIGPHLMPDVPIRISTLIRKFYL
jgi:dTDP-4-amino-4,6-dideoxygalactose transaminase